MNYGADGERPKGECHDLISGFLFRSLRNITELVRADGGTISATDLRSDENYDLSYGSSYRPGEGPPAGQVVQPHSRVELTGRKKVWSPCLSLQTDKVKIVLWLYREVRNGEPPAFTDDDKRAAHLLMNTSSLGLEHAMEVLRLRELLHWAGINTVKAMIHAIRAKDPYTSDHCQRVADYSARIAELMGYENVEEAWAAAAVHDVGKIGLLDAILDKPARLERSEMEAVREHPRWGGEIVSHFSDDWDLAPGVRHHHEWLDGRGYPDGLRAREIPLVARILTVADAYDAMTTTRPYRPSLAPSVALNRLSASSGIQFDPQVVAVARECLV